MTSIIEHLCASPQHQLPEDVGSPVVIFERRWAYCPAGVADGHDWRATGGRSLATVREWLRRPATTRDAAVALTVGVGR